MTTFKIPSKLYISKDMYGLIEATESRFGKIAEIKINQKPGMLGACTVDEYLGHLRQRALQAYRDGLSEIDA